MGQVEGGTGFDYLLPGVRPRRMMASAEQASAIIFRPANLTPDLSDLSLQVVVALLIVVLSITQGSGKKYLLTPR